MSLLVAVWKGVYARSEYFCVDMMSYSLTFIHMITYMKQMRVPFSLVFKNKHF